MRKAVPPIPSGEVQSSCAGPLQASVPWYAHQLFPPIGNPAVKTGGGPPYAVAAAPPPATPVPLPAHVVGVHDLDTCDSTRYPVPRDHAARLLDGDLDVPVIEGLVVFESQPLRRADDDAAPGVPRHLVRGDDEPGV